MDRKFKQFADLMLASTTNSRKIKENQEAKGEFERQIAICKSNIAIWREVRERHHNELREITNTLSDPRWGVLYNALNKHSREIEKNLQAIDEFTRKIAICESNIAILREITDRQLNEVEKLQESLSQ